eukprot:1709208-Alexandrium_andersonii.AAC.1
MAAKLSDSPRVEAAGLPRRAVATSHGPGVPGVSGSGGGPCCTASGGGPKDGARGAPPRQIPTCAGLIVPKR